MPNSPSSLALDWLHRGYSVLTSTIAEDLVEELQQDFAELSQGAHAVRGALGCSPTVQRVAELVQPLAEELACAPVKATKGTYFDKTAESNWQVAWHQDLTITVSERHEVSGFQHWRDKEGLWHVEPPVEILERIVALRLYLDDCPVDHGALRLIPGSHLQGKLSEETIAQFAQQYPLRTPELRAGQVLALSPLLLHASSKCEQPHHRRILHLEYSPDELPTPLRWQG